jgi:hypothetical protein
LILKRKACRIKDDLLNGNRRDKYSCLPHFWPPELENGVFRLKKGFLDDQSRGSLRGPW